MTVLSRCKPCSVKLLWYLLLLLLILVLGFAAGLQFKSHKTFHRMRVTISTWPTWPWGADKNKTSISHNATAFFIDLNTRRWSKQAHTAVEIWQTKATHRAPPFKFHTLFVSVKEGRGAIETLSGSGPMLRHPAPHQNWRAVPDFLSAPHVDGQEDN